MSRQDVYRCLREGGWLSVSFLSLSLSPPLSLSLSLSIYLSFSLYPLSLSFSLYFSHSLSLSLLHTHTHTHTHTIPTIYFFLIHHRVSQLFLPITRHMYTFFYMLTPKWSFIEGNFGKSFKNIYVFIVITI